MDISINQDGMPVEQVNIDVQDLITSHTQNLEQIANLQDGIKRTQENMNDLLEQDQNILAKIINIRNQPDLKPDILEQINELPEFANN